MKAIFSHSKIISSIPTKTIETVSSSPLSLVVSSHVDYASICLPRLISSLKHAGVPNACVRVVIGGSVIENEGMIDGILHRRVKHNSFEFTGPIDILDQDALNSYWFLLHDTCEAGPHFWQNVQQIDTSKPAYMASPEGWTNMGAYSWEFLQEAKQFIQAMRDCSKIRAMMSERVFMRMGERGSYDTEDYAVVGSEDIYGQGTPRQKCYFKALDLTKYMANHAGAREMMMKA